MLSGLIISKFCHTYAAQIAYCAIFGLTEGAYIGLTSVITIDIMGMETFVHAYGVQLFFMGAACVTGPPLIGENNLENLELNLILTIYSIGAFHTAMGDYDAGFYFAGGIILVSGIMLFLLPRKQQKTESSYSQPSIHFLETTFTIGSAVAWQLGVPSMVCRPMNDIQNTARNTQDHISDVEVTHL